jgi:predicted alpha/beta-fold hydrolase
MIANAWPPRIADFRPPWWLRSGHAQTLAAAFAPWRLPHYRAVSRRVELDDGDIVVVHDDCPMEWRPGDTAALLMHGLGGCHLSPLLVRLTDRLNARGVRVFRLDLRACGAGAGLARRTYHAGRSEDVASVMASIVRWCRTVPGANNGLAVHGTSAEESPIAVVGVSLSGNILLKYLGEDPDRVPSTVVRAMAVNPPIDLSRSIATLAGPINRWYDRHFVASLVRQLEDHFRRRPDAHRPEQRRRPRRLHDFDDWFTAPMGGFPNADTYYERCSAAQFMPGIRVPTLVLTSRDDPMVPAAMFESEQSRWPMNVHLEIAAGGGHVGYIARRGIDPDPHWLEWRALEFVTALGTNHACERIIPASIPLAAPA